MSSAFEDLLRELVSESDGAEGAVMSDYDGEPVAEVVMPHAKLDRYGVQLWAAQFRATLNKIEDLHQSSGWSSPSGMTIRTEDRSLFFQQLTDRYFVLLLMKNGHGLVGAEQRLLQTAQRMIREM